MEEQIGIYYTVSYLKNSNAEHEIFSTENVTVIETDPAGQELGFILLKKTT